MIKIMSLRGANFTIALQNERIRDFVHVGAIYIVAGDDQPAINIYLVLNIES